MKKLVFVIALALGFVALSGLNIEIKTNAAHAAGSGDGGGN